MYMQVTIELPDQLARRLQTEMGPLAEIIEQGLANRDMQRSGLWREVVAFLAQGPRPEEIVSFKPSLALTDRCRHLLEANRQGSLSKVESAELAELTALDQFMMLVKAEAQKVLRQART